VDIQTYIQSGVIESYVLGIADAQEAVELERLRHIYPAIEAAIKECEKWLQDSAHAGAVPVSDATKEKIFTAMQTEFNLQEDKAGEVTTISGVRFKYLTAASLILFIVSAGFNLVLYKKYTKAIDAYITLQNEHNTLQADNKIFQAKIATLNQDIKLLSAPGILKVPLPGLPGKEDNLVTLFWNTKTKDVYLIANHIPKAPEGSQYQLWALVDGKPVDAGVLDNCEGLCRLKPVQKAQAFAITLEKAGGSPTPTLTQMYVLGNVKS
jgi:anti-sigma-K factor RskA